MTPVTHKTAFSFSHDFLDSLVTSAVAAMLREHMDPWEGRWSYTCISQGNFWGGKENQKGTGADLGCADQLATIWHLISHYTVPANLKWATMLTIAKRERTTELNNYMPVILITAAMKVFEKLTLSHL